MAGSGVHLANAYVSLSVSAAGLRGQVDKAMGAATVGAGEKAGRSMGSRMAGAMGTALKTAAKTGAVAAGVAAGAAVVGGFKSAIQQENTEKTLSGLYGSASKATGMMGKLKAISKDSPIEYSAYGKAAESLAYAGVEGSKASKILDGVGMAIVGAGGGSEELQRAMDGILKGVNNGGIVMNDTLGMISESGFPIIDALQTKFGVTGDVIKKMASEGEISIDDVLEVMENGTGKLYKAQRKAGKEVSKTFGNQWKTAKDNVVTAIGSGMRPALASLAPLIGKAGDAVAGFVEDFSAGTGAAGKFRDVLARLGGYIGSGFKAAFSAVSPYFKQFGSAMAGLWPAVKSTASAVGDFLVAAFQAAKPYLEAAARVLGVVLVGAMKVLPPILRVVMGAFRGLLAMLKPLLPVIAAVAAAIGVKMALAMVKAGIQSAILTARTLALRGALMVASATAKISAARTLAVATAQKIAAAASKAWAIAQRLVNAAMRANPIGLLITGLLLLGAGLVLAYKKSETFRRIVSAAWAGIKKAASATVNWFKNVAWPVMKSVFQSIGKVAKWLWKNAIKPYFNFIWNLVKKVSGWIKNTGWPWIRKAFNAIGGRAKWLWKQIRQAFNWIWDKVKAVLGWIKNTGWKWIKKAFQGYAKIGKWLWRQMRDAWNWIRDKVKAVANFLKKWVWKWIKKAFQGYAKIGKWLWRQMRDAWNWIRNKIRDVVSWIKNTAWKRFIKPAFDAIAGRAQWMWRKVRDVFDRFKTGVGRLRDAIGRAKDGIKRSWGRILDAIKNPIKKALGWLQRNFVTKLRNMLDKVPGVSPSIIPNIPGVSGWARGGILPGYTPMGKGDDVLTPMRSGEGVMVSEGLRDSRSRSMFLAANAAAKRGTSFADFLGGGYAGGGIVGTYSGKKAALVALGRWMQRQGYHVSEHSKFGGNNPRYHMKGSKHNTDEALDVNADPWLTKFSSEKRALDRLNRKLRANDWHTLWRVKDHFDHLHVDTGSGGRSGNPLSMLINGFKNAASWMKGKFDKLTDGFDGSKYGLAGKILPAVFKKIRGAVKDKIKSAFDALSFGDSGNFDYGAVKGGTNRVMGKLMAAKRGWTGSQWSALEKLWTRESNWNHHAKNPSSGAYGIPQSLPASKMASAGSDWRTNPKTQIAWGLNYIACVPLDTEILTRRGWLKHDEVQVGDETIGYDPKTGLSVWTPITHVHHFEDAPVTRMHNSRFDARSTPNHRWVAEKYQQRVDVHGWQQEMVQTDQLVNRHRLVLAAAHESDTKLDMTPREAELLGWIMGDGSIYYGLNNRGGKRGKLNMTVGQTKPKYMSELRECLSEIPHSEYVTKGNHWSPSEGRSFRIRSEFGRDLLARSGYERDPEAMVLAMSQEQREAFFRGFMFADGCVGSDRSPMFAQNEGWKLDVALLTMYLLGHYGNPTDSAGQKHVTVDKATVKAVFSEEHLERQPVWCVTTKADTWTMRQGGRVMLTGNSRYGSPLSAWAHSQRTGWYAKGTLSARRGPAVVGEQGPELLWMRGGERIASHRQSKRLMASQPAAARDALSGPVYVNVIDRDGTFVERMRGEIRDHDRFNRSVSRMGGVR